MRRIRFAIAVVWSHLESWFWRVDQMMIPRPRSFNGFERRKNPRHCALCHGPMRSDRRPPRDARGVDGKIRRLPEEVLAWSKCSRCHQSQVGVPQ